MEAQIYDAFNLCKYDIEVNEDFSFISYYYRAICNIFFSNIGNAIEDLKKAKELIEKDNKFFINFCCMLPYDIQNFKKSIDKKYNLYMNLIKAIIEPSINKLQNSSRKILLKKKFLSEVFDKTPKDLGIEEEINSLRIIGFNSVFFLYEKAPWYKALGISILGIFEVGIGYLLSSISPILGRRIINHGITNIGKGIEMLIGEGKDFENKEDFWKFQKENAFMDFLIPLTIKRDEKKKYNVYKMVLENDSLLKEKIILRREKAFKELFDYNLKQIEISFDEEERKIEKTKVDMSQLKEDVINKILENKMKDENFKNIFLTFYGQIEYLRNFIISTVNNEFLKYDITKEISLVNTKTELVKIISQKIKDKINESINKKKKDLEVISSFLIDFKNKILKECTEKLEEEKNAFNEEEKKTNLDTQLNNANKEQTDLVEQYNKQQVTYQENKNNELDAEIQEEQNKINNEIKNNNNKLDIYNNMVKDQNNGKVIDAEKMKQLYEDLQSFAANIQQKKDAFTKKVEDIKAKAEEEKVQQLGEFKKNFDEETKRLQNKMEELKNNYQKEIEEHNQKLKNLNDLTEKALKLKNDDFDIDENGIKIKDEELSNNQVYQNVMTGINKDFSINFGEVNDFWNNDYAGIVSDQVTKIEDKINLKQEEERENKINNFGRGMGGGDNNNPVDKCYIEDYEYNSKDMKIIGKQILGNDFDYFIDYDKKDLKEKIKNKKTIIGNYQDIEQKIWNTVCMIPDGDNYIILYNNFLEEMICIL